MRSQPFQELRDGSPKAWSKDIAAAYLPAIGSSFVALFDRALDEICEKSSANADGSGIPRFQLLKLRCLGDFKDSSLQFPINLALNVNSTPKGLLNHIVGFRTGVQKQECMDKGALMCDLTGPSSSGRRSRSGTDSNYSRKNLPVFSHCMIKVFGPDQGNRMRVRS